MYLVTYNLILNIFFKHDIDVHKRVKYLDARMLLNKFYQVYRQRIFDTLSKSTKKEIYNIHVASVFIKPEFKILKCRPELENIEVGKYINIAFQNKIKYIDDRELAEFNYKIINNILINKSYLSKWISETNAKCSFCNQKEDTIHLLYDCSFNDHIWHIVGNCLQLNITYKLVVLEYSSTLKNC